MKDYLEIYKIEIGTKVTVNECHSRPEIVGKLGRVVGWVDVETCGYPLMVYLDEPVYIPVPGLGLAAPFQGPLFCRPDELTVLAGDIPEIFTKPFEEENKKEGNQDEPI